MSALKGLKVGFVIPSPIEGSGGIGEIFNRARAIVAAGARCDMYVKDPVSLTSAELTERTIRYYGDHQIQVFASPRIETEYDVLIATSWDSARIVRDAPAVTRLYLVQDFEAMFNPMGDGYLLGEESYLYGLKPITLGRWLARKLLKEYGLDSHIMPFTANLDVYRPQEQSRPSGRSVCFVYQPEKPRRCSRIGIEALGLVKHRRPDTTIYFFGSHDRPRLWFPYEHLGLLSLAELNELYNSCDVGLCISSSNPSRVPFEMMAAGLPVVDLYRQNNLFDLPEDGVLLAHQTAESIAEAVIRVLDDPDYGRELGEAGHRFMQDKPISAEHEVVIDAIRSASSGNRRKPHGDDLSRRIYHREPIIAPKYQNSTSVLTHCALQAGRVLQVGDRTAEGTIEPANGSWYRNLSPLPSSLVDRAVATFQSPSDINHDLFKVYEGSGTVSTHPFEGGICSGIIPGGFPAGSRQIIARVVTDHSNGPELEYGIALTASDDSGLKHAGSLSKRPRSRFNDDDVPTSWARVGPKQTTLVRLDLPEVLDQDCDVHFGVRVPPGNSTDFAWALWLGFAVG